MDDYIMISAIQHYSYCPRQCALIHCEQVFDENIFTIQGRQVHERVDDRQEVTEQQVKKFTSLAVWSDRLKITGICDLVEFYDDQPYPVEYKFGRINKKDQIHDELQLCAQALCLEERLGKSVPEGAIYHHSSRKRRVVKFSDWHRQRVVEIVAQINELFKDPRLPPAVNDARCKNCSLLEICMPELTHIQKRPHWIKKLFLDDEE